MKSDSTRDRFLLGTALRRLASNTWKVALYASLIVLCVLFAPEQPLKFAYTEF